MDNKLRELLSLAVMEYVKRNWDNTYHGYDACVEEDIDIQLLLQWVLTEGGGTYLAMGKERPVKQWANDALSQCPITRCRWCAEKKDYCRQFDECDFREERE
jgi:hypothetical protein